MEPTATLFGLYFFDWKASLFLSIVEAGRSFLEVPRLIFEVPRLILEVLRLILEVLGLRLIQGGPKGSKMRPKWLQNEAKMSPREPTKSTKVSLGPPKGTQVRARPAPRGSWSQLGGHFEVV